MHPPQQQPQQYGPPMQQWQPGPPPPPPKKRGKGVAFAVVGGAVVVLGLLGGLVKLTGGDTTTAKPSVSAKPTSTAAVASKIPKPDAQQTEDLLYGLRQIDKELDRARSIDRARNTCSDLLQGKTRGQVVQNTRLRFDGVGDIDLADARAIVKLIEAGGWCR